MSKMKHKKKQKKWDAQKIAKNQILIYFSGVGLGVASPGARLRN